MTTHHTNIRRHKIKSCEKHPVITHDTDPAQPALSWEQFARTAAKVRLQYWTEVLERAAGLLGSSGVLSDARTGKGQRFFLVLMTAVPTQPLRARWTPHWEGRQEAECSAGWGFRWPCHRRYWGGPTGCWSTGGPRPTAGRCSLCLPGTGRSSGQCRCAPGRGSCPRRPAASGWSQRWAASWRWAAVLGLGLRNGSLLLRQQTRPRW